MILFKRKKDNEEVVNLTLEMSNVKKKGVSFDSLWSDLKDNVVKLGKRFLFHLDLSTLKHKIAKLLVKNDVVEDNRKSYHFAFKEVKREKFNQEQSLKLSEKVDANEEISLNDILEEAIKRDASDIDFVYNGDLKESDKTNKKFLVTFDVKGKTEDIVSLDYEKALLMIFEAYKATYPNDESLNSKDFDLSEFRTWMLRKTLEDGGVDSGFRVQILGLNQGIKATFRIVNLIKHKEVVNYEINQGFLFNIFKIEGFFEFRNDNTRFVKDVEETDTYKMFLSVKILGKEISIFGGMRVSAKRLIEYIDGSELSEEDNGVIVKEW